MPVFLCVNRFEGFPRSVLVRAVNATEARWKLHYRGMPIGWKCFRVTRARMPRDQDIVVVNGRLDGAKVYVRLWPVPSENEYRVFDELGVQVVKR